ncbi:MAG: PaaI family thioesterase [Rhodocyclaceae bacterium]|nr:PaaI family thioesterase [Rhodocyclaceae bacterium]MCP5307761.1 PaaI family thioesterase [Zoogloeaceae bacterium]
MQSMTTRFEARDPLFEQRVRESFRMQPLMAFIGAELVAVTPGRCEIRLPFRNELAQQNGFFHGGIIGTLADNAGGFAAYSLMPHDAGVLTVEYKLNLMAPADGEMLRAEGDVVRAGRNLVVSRAEVHVAQGDRWVHCASMQQTLMTMHGKGVS